MRLTTASLVLLAFAIPALTFAAVCPQLSRNLSRGMSGDDVKALQQFLIDQDDLALGYDTGYFGGLTEAAVQKFQCDKNIVCEGDAQSAGWGSVGPKTRAAIASVCGQSGQGGMSSTHTSSPTTPLIPFQSGGAGSCEWSGVSVANGATVTAYRDYIAVNGSECISEERTCKGGKLSGSYPYSWCAPENPSSCTLDGIIVLDGQYQTYYSSRTVPQTMTCADISAQRECLNGTLTGSSDFRYTSCFVTTASSSLPVAPTGLHVSCNPAGTNAVLSWDSMPGAATYGIRLIRNATSTFSKIIDWYVGTSYSADITPDTYYSWWVHANPDSSTLGPYSVGDLFKCAASSTSS